MSNSTIFLGCLAGLCAVAAAILSHAAATYNLASFWSDDPQVAMSMVKQAAICLDQASHARWGAVLFGAASTLDGIRQIAARLRQ